MKDIKGTRRSANARLNQLVRETDRLHKLANQLKTDFNPVAMSEFRHLTASVMQCFHEYNAYHNVLSEEV